jgi:hypothetical protein
MPDTRWIDGFPLVVDPTGTGDVFLDGFFFSAGEAAPGGEPDDSARVTQTRLQTLLSADNEAQVTQTRLQTLLTADNTVRVTQLRKQVLYSAPTTVYTPPSDGGGTIPDGTNPPEGTFIETSSPQFFIVLKKEGGEEGYSNIPLADRPDYYGGEKDPIIIKIERVRRALSDVSGGIQVTTWSGSFTDTDRRFRQRWDEENLKSREAEMFYIDHDTRIDEGVAFRVCGGILKKPKFNGDMTVDFSFEDTFGPFQMDPLSKRKFPEVTSVENIPTVYESFTQIPICDWYGLLSDETASDPGQGVVPAKWVGWCSLAAFGGVDVACDIYLVAGHACKNILGVYFNYPNTPEVREKVPESLFGVYLTCPHKPGWMGLSGQAGQYLEVFGRRWTIIAVRREPIMITVTDPVSGDPEDIDMSLALREERSTLTVNLEGVETVGDATGDRIDDLVDQCAHWLANRVFANNTLDWGAIPTFNGYSIIDTVAVALARTRGQALYAGGILGAFGIGVNGQEDLKTILSRFFINGFFEGGFNRHGQFVIDREDETAEPVLEFSDQDHILKGTLSFESSDNWANRIRYLHTKRYVGESPRATPPEGYSLPAFPTKPYADWYAEVETLNHDASIALHGVKEGELYEFSMIRSAAIANVVGSLHLARLVGPAPRYEGAMVGSFQTNLQGLGFENEVAELGKVIGITHFAGSGASGWANQAARILAISLDEPKTGKTSIEFRSLGSPDIVVPPGDEDIPSESKVLTFTKSTTTGEQIVTGVGFRGKCIIFLSTRQTVYDKTDGAVLSMGVSDAIANMMSRAIAWADNETVQRGRQVEGIDYCIWLPETSATDGAAASDGTYTRCRAEFVSFSDDGFTINWLTNDSHASLIHVLVLGGGLGAKLVNMATSIGTTVTQEGMGFLPKGVISFAGAISSEISEYDLDSPFGSFHAMGFCDTTLTPQTCSWALHCSPSTPSAANTYAKKGQANSGRLTSMRTANLATAGELIYTLVTGFTADGFTLQTGGSGGLTPSTLKHNLGLGYCYVKSFIITQPAAPGLQDYDVGFRPMALIVQTVGEDADNNAIQDNAFISIGVADQDLVQRVVWVGGPHNQATSVVARGNRNDAIIVVATPNATGASSSEIAIAYLDSYLENGVRLRWTVSDGVARECIAYAIGSITQP